MVEFESFPLDLAPVKQCRDETKRNIYRDGKIHGEIAATRFREKPLLKISSLT